MSRDKVEKAQQFLHGQVCMNRLCNGNIVHPDCQWMKWIDALIAAVREEQQGNAVVVREVQSPPFDYSELIEEAAEQQRGHVANCRCCKEFVPSRTSSKCWTCQEQEAAHPYRDPLCGESIELIKAKAQRDELMCAMARAEVPKLMKAEIERTGMSAEDALLIGLESTRIEVDSRVELVKAKAQLEAFRVARVVCDSSYFAQAKLVCHSDLEKQARAAVEKLEKLSKEAVK